MTTFRNIKFSIKMYLFELQPYILVPKLRNVNTKTDTVRSKESAPKKYSENNYFPNEIAPRINFY